ncbi:hypothetical protein ZHAS_00014625 [Anopheles sinensis]|uniref:Tox-SGS domain-containing protein n=1 Tax=Anopheles sinensis TaxID=74873 RepID=A0A084W8P2_ANOSI|nr:hypothetical protein ZHAS_00014625 [Anopheles sinensis]
METPSLFYTLQLPGETLVKAAPDNVVEVKQDPTTVGSVFVRINRTLRIYEPSSNGVWLEKHRVEELFSVGDHDPNYPWDVYGDGLLVVRKTEGIVVYRWSAAKFQQLIVAAKYSDVYGYADPNNTVLIGKMYPSDAYIGVLTRLGSTVEFRSINPTATGKPVRSLQKQPELDDDWINPSSTISLVEKYDGKKGQLAIALRTATELKLFRFNDKYGLEKLTTIQDIPPLDKEFDRIMFVKFDKATVHDMLHFSGQGLTMYRRNETNQLFEKVYYSTVFSKYRGWTRRTIETITTVDFNGDGLDELLCSGPRGLSLYQPTFTEEGFDLVNVFDETLQDRAIRYGLPRLVPRVAAPGGNVNNILLFTGGSLINVRTKLFTPPSNDVARVEPEPEKPQPPAGGTMIVPQSNYIVWLHDQLDLNALLQPLNPHTGAVDLSIPLIELPNAFGVSVRKMFQYKNIPYQSCLGRGWSLPLDYIAVERKNSAFAQDHDYAILKNNQRILLKPFPHWDSVYHRAFIIEGYKQAKIKYFADEEQWEVTMEDRKFFYGRWKTLRTIRKDMVCVSWPLCGPKLPLVKELPSRWYLVREESLTGQYANYTYAAVNAGNSYRLAAIRLDNGSNVRLNYTANNLLSNYTVKTSAYEQNVFLDYDGQSLREIRQEDRTLFKFGYQNDRMTTIVYPNGLESNLDYSELTIDRSRFEEVIPVGLSPTIYYGPDYTVLLDRELEDDRMVLRIHTLLGGTDGMKATGEKMYFGQPGIRSHMIHALENLLVLVLIYESWKEVTFVQYTRKEWVEKKHLDNFPLDGTIGAGKRFIVTLDLKRVQVYSIDHSGTLVTKDIMAGVPKNLLLRAFVNGFILYENANSITVWTLGYNERWQKGWCNQISNDIFAEVDKFIRQFDITDEFKGALHRGMLADAVTVHQNAVVIRMPILHNHALEIRTVFLIMNFDRQPKEVFKNTVKLPITNMTTYEYELRTNDGNLFTMHYPVVNGKYTLTMKRVTGPLLKTIEDQRQSSYKNIDDSKESSAKKQELKKEVDRKLAEERISINRTIIGKVQFAMDLSQFGVLSNQNGVLTGNRQLSYDGNTWVPKPVTPAMMRLEQVDQMLGEGFKLVKREHNDTFKVYEVPQNRLVFDTNTNNPQEIQIVAPRYVQAQPSKQPLSVFFFKTKETVTLPSSERMNRASNSIALVTVSNVNETAKYVIFRPVDAFLLKQTTIFSKQTLRLDRETTRVTGQVYNASDAQLSSEGAMFYRVKVTPGDDPRRFGWYEQATDTSTGHTVRKTFAADGTDVTDRGKEKKNREPKKDLVGTIWDRSRQLKIVDLGALRLVDEVVSYYGFEKYELNQYGKDNKWIFDPRQVEYKWENHYLSLPTATSLRATFTPADPINIFVVSCWISLGNTDVKVGNVVNAVKVVVTNLADSSKQTISGAKVQHAVMDWRYVETTIDTTKFPKQAKLTFDVMIETPNSRIMLVDHVRFSPLDMNFRANIYTPVTAELRAIHNNNGLLQQSLYSPRGKRVALLSEYGQLVDFSMHSKTAFSTLLGARSSLLEMKPRRGMFEGLGDYDWRPEAGGKWSGGYGMLKFADAGRGEIVRLFSDRFETIALRFLYQFESPHAKLSCKWRKQEFEIICPQQVQSCRRPPKIGEILLFITPLRVSVWLEGSLVGEHLIKSTFTQHEFSLVPTGQFQFSEFLVMFDSRAKLTYHNAMGRPVQVVEYLNPRTARLREILYDEIDRPTMQTKWTKITYDRHEYFAFNENFVTQVDGGSHRMAGIVSTQHPSCDGYPYSHTVYANDPSENKQFQGLPGKEYSVSGKYKRRYALRSEILLLSNLFPEKDGFRQKIVERPGKAIRATVEDLRGKKVAKFWQVGNYDHRLTTYEYSETYGYLYRELPPQYHALVKTTSRTRPFYTGGNTQEENRLKKLWEMSYNEEDGRLVMKRTPDGGSYEYVYNEQGILRYTIHYAKEYRKDIDRVIHFTYAANGKLSREALVNMTVEQCYLSLEEAPPSEDLIETTYGELDTNPLVRYRSQQSTRRIGQNHMIESLIFDEKERLLKKIFVVPTINTTYSIDYEYENENVRSVRYPVDSPTSSFKLLYDYNGHGEVAAIRESTQRDPFFQFTYNADGMMETMKVRTGTAHFFQRNFTYNEPGFLVKLADDFLTEDVSYVETDSYGQDSYTPIYEGLISRTIFTAHWQRTTSSLRTSLFPEDLISNSISRKQAIVCFDVLKQKGYLNEINEVNRTFYGERDDDLPFICGDVIPLNHLSSVLSSGSFPQLYGHRYDYDDHDQLIKAKYFHGSDELRLTPLTYRSFAKEIEGVKESDSKKIWDALLAERFLSSDCTNPNLCHGRPGPKSMFGDFIRQHRYHKHLQTLFSKAIIERKALTGDEFDARCKRWIEGSNMGKNVCRDIKNSLAKRNLIGNSPQNSLDSLSETFRNALKRYKSQIPDIVRVLSHHFATALGRSAGDVQSYEIDANGNHRMFYTGFSRYRLEYREGTNQITKLHRLYFDRDQREEEHFNMEHNSDGAVVKAEHKGINHMEYDRILHRVTKMEMTDGRKLIFQYDVRAERTFKQVLNPDGTVSHEKYYIRDANGLVLVDMELTYLAKDQPPDVRVTSYIYKDQQLVGFVRNDKLYGVISDHEGSVRLIVRDGEVVAAYDYLPYGQIFRRYGTDLDGQISYLYTGQEWEPETGLYNYRARLYDPDIGRFYQMDPKEQYPSPYVYAGNSPVSLVDPDGEFAFALAVFIMAIIGAYLGAASANNCWNPLKWDWRSSSTWLGLLTGAVTGASIPFNMASSVAFFVGLGLSMSTSIAIMVGAGITFAYFTIAASSGTWDPTKFDFTSPGTWNALMNGVATSSWILMNPSSLISSFTTLTSVAAKALFIVAKVTMSLGFTYLFAAISQGGEFDVTKWDFSDPALYMSVIDGFTTATVGLLFARNIPKQVNKWTGKVKRTVDLFVSNSACFRTQVVLGRDWSSKIMLTNNYLYVNFRNMQTLTKGFLTVGFYSVVCSLRVSQMFNSPIPEYTAAEAAINVLFTTEQFSDFIVKPLSPATPKMMLPKPPNVARLLRFRIRSEAIALGNESIIAPDWMPTRASSGASSLPNVFERILMYPFAWLFGEDTPKESTSDSAKVSFPSPQPEKSERSSYMLRNCYQLRSEQHPDGMIACYGHSTVVSILPKQDQNPKIGLADRYKHCLPLTYDGNPSVSCDGEWSSLLYTAQEAPRIFDFVDGWLLLAQIAPSVYKELKKGITYLVSDIKKPERSTVDEEILSYQTEKLHGKLEVLRMQVQSRAELSWACWVVEDLIEDVHDYFNHGMGSFRLLSDKVEALEEDVHESMAIHRLQRTCKEMHQTGAYKLWKSIA